MSAGYKISVKKDRDTLDGSIYAVEVLTEEGTHSFQVSIDKGYIESIVGHSVLPMLFLQQSFAFLLAHEPVSSILRDFNVKEIQTYFDDYESGMQSLFK